MKQIDIRCKGSYSTITYFKNANKDTIRVEVWFHKEMTVCNQITHYNYNISIKYYKHRLYRYICKGSGNSDNILGNIITAKELYIAFYNHWNQLNPIGLFPKFGPLEASHNTKLIILKHDCNKILI